VDEFFGPQIQNKLIVQIFAVICCPDLLPSAVDYTETSNKEFQSQFNPSLINYFLAVPHLKDSATQERAYWNINAPLTGQVFYF
jgi:hypothetical protein